MEVFGGDERVEISAFQFIELWIGLYPGALVITENDNGFRSDWWQEATTTSNGDK